MSDVVNKSKLVALRLYKQTQGAARSGASLENPLLKRLKQLPAFASLADTEVTASVRYVDMSDCLNIIAIEEGFENWQAFLNSLIDDDSLLYRNRESDVSLNIWFATYEESKSYQDSCQNCYIFPYKSTFFICQATHIENLGVDPKDPDWGKIGYDWVQPLDCSAQERLRAKLIAARK